MILGVVCMIGQGKKNIEEKGEIKFGSVSGKRSEVDRGRAGEEVAVLASLEVEQDVIEWKEGSSRLM